MRLLPSRRWLQFRLSTWFVLMAILAGAMACQPWLVREEQVVYVSRNDFIRQGSPGYQHDRIIGGGIETLDDGSARYHYRYEHHKPNASLAWPTAALAAFFAWKVARAIRSAQFTKSRAPF